MASETDITQQLADYFGWLEIQLGSTGLALATPARPAGHRRLALVAASLLIVVGLAAAWTFTRGSTDSVRPTDTSNVTSATSVSPTADDGWQRSPGPPIEKRFQHKSVATASGWFVWGGVSALSSDPAGVLLNDGAYLDTATNQWRVLPPAPFTVENNYVGQGVWTGREVVLTQGGPQPLVAAFDPTTFTWRTIPISADVLDGWQHEDGEYSVGRAVMIGTTMAVLFGHGSGSKAAAAMLLFDTTSETWTQATAPPTLQGLLVAATGTALYVVQSGEFDTVDGCLGESTLWSYDLGTKVWSHTQLPHGNWQPAFAATVGGRVLVAGGAQCGSAQPVRDAAMFDPATGIWSDVAPMPVDDRALGIAPTVVNGWAVDMTGEGRPVIYDPVLNAWWYGPSLLPTGATGVDRRSSVVVINGRISIASPGWNNASDSNCCDSTGEVFSIALPSAADFGKEPLPTVPPATRREQTVAAGSCGYTVVKGDSFFLVAHHFGITLAALQAANPGRTMLLPDDMLVIPVSPCPAGTTSAT